MRRSLGVIVLASLCLLAGDEQGARPGEKRSLAPPMDEGIAEGPVQIARPAQKPARHGPARAKVVRVWTHGEGKHRWIQDWEKAHFGDKPVLRLQVGDTPYSLLLVGGRVEPLIATGTGAWRLEAWKTTSAG